MLIDELVHVLLGDASSLDGLFLQPAARAPGYGGRSVPRAQSDAFNGFDSQNRTDLESTVISFLTPFLIQP